MKNQESCRKCAVMEWLNKEFTNSRWFFPVMLITPVLIYIITISIMYALYRISWVQKKRQRALLWRFYFYRLFCKLCCLTSYHKLFVGTNDKALYFWIFSWNVIFLLTCIVFILISINTYAHVFHVF